ncbi:hypothetical protein, partial [Enterococcus faecalis]|uniref:hypothetical protein n=1 Tax=Enterococcus faecalis TaxID=1351 RepID=UPI001C400DF8
SLIALALKDQFTPSVYKKTNRCDCSAWPMVKKQKKSDGNRRFLLFFYFTSHSLLRTAYLRLLSVLVLNSS